MCIRATRRAGAQRMGYGAAALSRIFARSRRRSHISVLQVAAMQHGVVRGGIARVRDNEFARFELEAKARKCELVRLCVCEVVAFHQGHSFIVCVERESNVTQDASLIEDESFVMNMEI